MNSEQLQNIGAYVHSNGAHESGHITVLFKAGRLVGLRFLPHEMAADGVDGVFQTDPTTPLGKEDCIALAAGMVGELVGVGHYGPERALDDRAKVQQICSQPLENFALEAYEVIKQNLLFFVLLNIEVRKKMLTLLLPLSEEDYAELPDEMPLLTLAEVQHVNERAESTLASFPGATSAL
jgi:hypothetical protein